MLTWCLARCAYRQVSNRWVLLPEASPPQAHSLQYIQDTERTGEENYKRVID